MSGGEGGGGSSGLAYARRWIAQAAIRVIDARQRVDMYPLRDRTMTMVEVRLSRMADKQNVMVPMIHINDVLERVLIRSVMILKPCRGGGISKG